MNNEELTAAALATVDDQLPAEIDQVPLERETADVINKIVKAGSTDELKSYVDMFNLNIAKKNALRVAKLQNLADAVVDQAVTRADKHASEFTNKEIIDYIRVVNEQIKSAKDELSAIGESPAVQINNQKNEVNINVVDGLNQESKHRVLDAIKALIQQAKAPAPDDSLYNTYDSDEDDEDMEDDDAEE